MIGREFEQVGAHAGLDHFALGAQVVERRDQPGRVDADAHDFVGKRDAGAGLLNGDRTGCWRWREGIERDAGNAH